MSKTKKTKAKVHRVIIWKKKNALSRLLQYKAFNSISILKVQLRPWRYSLQLLTILSSTFLQSDDITRSVNTLKKKRVIKIYILFYIFSGTFCYFFLSFLFLFLLCILFLFYFIFLSFILFVLFCFCFCTIYWDQVTLFSTILALMWNHSFQHSS